MRIALFTVAAALIAGGGLLYHAIPPAVEVRAETSPVVARFEIDAQRSHFTVHAGRSGLLWFRGHDHYLAVRDFQGHVELALDTLNPASLEMTVRADSLEETGAVFTSQQKNIINREVEEIVLETAKYAEITFRSTEVKGEMKNGQFDVKIKGDLSLHGVTKSIVIPAKVSLEADGLRAVGKFSIDRSDFNVKATNAFHGTVRVKNRLKFTFDIVARRV
jgi:polyisoprenoid-binding protein YceI